MSDALGNKIGPSSLTSLPAKQEDRRFCYCQAIRVVPEFLYLPHRKVDNNHKHQGEIDERENRSLREPSPRSYYVPALPRDDTSFQLRAVADPTSLITAVRQAAREVDANLPFYNIKTLAAQVDETLVQERLISTVSSFFGLLSLLLAGIGLYGILAYAVRPTDPMTFVVTPILLLTVALLATFVPARRATNVDPRIAIRQE